MYAVGAPGPAARPGTGQLRIRAAARRAFPGPPAIAARPDHRPHLQEYLSDLVRPYRLTLREEPGGSDVDSGHSYGEMAAALIGELVGQQEPVGVVVLAFAIPDVRPGRATATYLGELCPGDPLAFAVCDQGAAAAHTGLRLAGEYARSGDCRRALLLVVEQSGLPYDTGLPMDAPAGHRAVGLRCEPAGPAVVRGVRQHADVAPGRAAELLAGALAEAVASRGGSGEVCLIADGRLAGELAAATVAGRVRVIPTGRSPTAGWWELAGALAGPAGPAGQRLILASYDRQLCYLSVSTIDVEAGR